MSENAFQELQEISFSVKSPTKGVIEVVLARDLQRLTGADDEIFEAAINAVKFSATMQGISLLVFFYTIDEGEIMTMEAAIAVASMCAPVSDFSLQMRDYVGKVTDFCLSMSELEVDSDDEE